MPAKMDSLASMVHPASPVIQVHEDLKAKRDIPAIQAMSADPVTQDHLETEAQRVTESVTTT